MSDWKITITDNNSGTHTPHIYAPPGEAYPKEIPAANGVPTLQFGVLPKDSGSWFDAKFENCDITVEKDPEEDGTFVTQPYDTLIGPTDDAGQGIVVLEAEGGEELQQRVDTSVDVTPTHEAASQVVSNNTTYSEDIPTPSTTRTDNVTILDRSTTGSITSADVEKIPEDSPAYITGSGYLTAYQTLWSTTSTGALSSEADEFTFSFTTNYSIPADRVGAGFLTDIGEDHVGLELEIDGTVVGALRPGADILTGSDAVSLGTPVWVQRTGAAGRLAPGSHTLTVSVTQATDAADRPLNGLTPDAVCVYDAKWDSEYNFGSGTTSPDLYPDQVPVPLSEPVVTRSVRGLTAASTTWTGGNAGAWRFSNDGDTFSSGTDVDFADHGAVADGVALLQSYNSGQSVTELQGFELQADLETMPLVVNDDFEGTVADVLTDLADTLRGDFVWTFDSDAANTPAETVRFVRTGSRTNTDNDIEHYKIRKSTSDLLDEVKVLGGRPSTAEQVRADHGTAVDLVKDDLLEDSETVTSPDRDQPYERGIHYSMDYSAGTITADGSPPADADAIPNDELVTIEYQFQPSSTATVSSPSSPKRTQVVTILALQSDRGCNLAAQEILDAGSSPSYVATAQVRGDTTYSPVAELVAGRLPVSNLETVDIQATPAGASIRLEGQRSPADAITEVRDRIESVARHAR